jgi:hypothetical protein
MAAVAGIGAAGCSWGETKGSKRALAADAGTPSAKAKEIPTKSDPAGHDGAGVEVVRHGDLTLVRVDPKRHRFVVLTALADGGARKAPAWVEDFRIAGAINASMFHADQRSIGLLVDADTVNNGRDNPKLGGFFAFDPVDASSPPVVFAGRSCAGFDLAELRKRYRAVVQNYRMLDCDGSPLRWADPKQFSAAAIGLDRDGHVVFIHSRKPHVMTRLNELVADPALGIVAAHYVEGGPEASLFVDIGEHSVSEVGSFETGFFESDENLGFWDIPNVIGFAPR